ncbi:MAG: hypothetical protein M0Z30_02160 [Actinomycetota bacterium]|nr:hypothetical protein [Actinomycetota bacterium]
MTQIPETIDLRDDVLSPASAFQMLRDIAYKELAPHRVEYLISAAASQVDAVTA